METNQPQHTNFTSVGLDVSKARLDYTVDGERCLQVDNTSEGHARLIAGLRQIGGRVRVIVEATGGYQQAVVDALCDAQIEVCVVNPGRVRAFAHANGQWAKTDKIDARMLKLFGEKVSLRAYVRAEHNTRELRDLLEFRRMISDQLVATRNRLEVVSLRLRALIEAQVAHLEASMVEIDRQIKAHIADDPQLKQKAERLCELQGVGPVLSATLLAYVPELGRVGDKSLAALIGVAPYPKDSGTHAAKRRIRGGRSVVRHVLYMAAIAASKFNPVLSAFYRRLKNNGKAGSVALIAVMRKMLTVINRMMTKPDFVLVR